MRLLRDADRVARPWKNGGGTTREVMVSPDGASFDAFHWRVSIAEVTAAGPFSTFGGIDRTLMVLAGRLALRFDSASVELSRASEPCAFPGEAACWGAPLDGPVTDLNVMVRRGRYRAACRHVSDGVWIGHGNAALLVAASPVVLRVAERDLALQPHDAVHLQEPFKLEVRGDAFAIAIEEI